MIEALYSGIGLGLALSMMIGPVFFALIDTGIRKGLREGAKMALGINISDWVYAAVTTLGVGGLVTRIGNSHYFTIVGGVVLILFGIFNIIPKKNQATAWEPPNRTDIRKRFSGLGKGFILNSLNPGTPLIWLIASTAGSGFLKEGGVWLQVFFIVSILVTILATDLAKVYLGRRFLKALSPRRISLINKGVGIVMIVAGLRFVWMGFDGQSVKAPEGLKAASSFQESKSPRIQVDFWLTGS